MSTLSQLARVVRSKNAGPTVLTVDILCEDAGALNRVAAGLTADRVAPLYGLEASEVHVLPVPAAHALKIVLPRKVTAGSPGDRDAYGAQQHAPLLDVDL